MPVQRGNVRRDNLVLLNAILYVADIRDAMTKLEAGQQSDNAEAVHEQKSAQ